MSVHLHKTPIKVSGHLEDRRGIYHIMLSWNDVNGKRKRKCASTGLQVKGNKKRAEWMLDAARKAQEQLLVSIPGSQDILFADFMEQWLEVIRREVKITTFGSYQVNVQEIIVPYFREKGILLKDITANDINEFYSLQASRVKATTIHKYHANIIKALKYALDKELIERSPLEKIKRPKAERYVSKYLKLSEVVELFEASIGHKLELGIIICSYYGLRRGEILGLKWSAIDFEANSISIEHTVTSAYVDGKSITVIGDTTKTESSLRTLPLVPCFRRKLLSIKEEQEKNRKLCGKSYNTEDAQYIYTDQLGKRIDVQYLTRAFPKFLVENGFPRIRFHDLRHSCASLLAASGVSMKQIQEWLGHSDFIVTANRYTHLDFSSKLDTANSMKWIERTSLWQDEAKEQVQEAI